MTKRGAIVGVLFGLPFFGAGVAVIWFVALQPLLLLADASDWAQVPCVITRSEVDTNSSSDGDTYRIDIAYKYEYEGVRFTSERYDISIGSSSGHSGKLKVVRAHPVGSTQMCYVNPEAPHEALISRRIPGIVWFALPFGGLFALIGGAVILASLGVIKGKPSNVLEKGSFGGKRRAARMGLRGAQRMGTQRRFGTAPDLTPNEGRMTLEPRHSPMTKVFGLALFALIWNGVVGVFVYQAFSGRGGIEWGTALLMIPFLLVGLLIIAGLVHSILALRNPKVQLIVEPATPYLGRELDLDWEVRGNTSRLQSLEVFLEGHEVATYRRGTRTVTDRSVFARIPVLKTDRRLSRNNGHESVVLPEDKMHTWASPNNRIEWVFRVKGDIPRWPDISDEYPVVVLPAPYKGGQS